MVKTIGRRTASILLALALLLGSLGVTAYADAPGTDGAQSDPATPGGGDEDGPDEDEPEDEIPGEDGPEDDEEGPEDGDRDGDPADGQITAFAALDESVRWQSGYQPVLPETLAATVDGETADVPVTWRSDTWTADAPEVGLHAFTAEPVGYGLAAGVTAPTILYMQQTRARMAGAGTEANPLQITSAEQLAEIGALVNKGGLEELVHGNSAARVYLRLMNDVSLSAYSGGEGWTPIGNGSYPFTGDFDGGGHVITGLTVNRDSEFYVGLFGWLEGGTVRNLGLVNASVSGDNGVGGVAGGLENNSAVTNCYVTGSVSGSMAVGGVVGYVQNSSAVTNCYVTGSVNGSYIVGGVAGYLGNNSTVTNCYATASVRGSMQVGGVAGYLENSIVSNCAALNPSVYGGSDVGRVVGWNSGNTLSGNIAFDGMTGSFDGDNGESKTAAALQDSGGFPAGFTGDPWTYEARKLPGLGGGTVEMPAHILAGLGGGVSPFDGGDGTSESSAYEIRTAEQLAALAALVNSNADSGSYRSAHYKLTADVDLSGYSSGDGWTPIGVDYSTPFTGNFDGGGHVITGLTVSSGDNNVGLFGVLDNGTVRNLGLVNVNVSGDIGVGGVAGTLNNNSAVTNCYVTGAVSGNGNVGGVAGNVYGSVTNCYATATVRSTGNNVGGVAGAVSSTGSVTNCAALNPSVESGGSSVGRVVGYDGGALTGNIAFGGMLVNGGTVSGGTAINKDGESKTADALQDSTGFPGGFTSDPWTYEAGRLPGLGERTVEMPGHILAGLNSGNPFDGGGGTSTYPYLIRTAAQLEALEWLVNAGNMDYSRAHYKLTDDIDLSGYSSGDGWTPIGADYSTPFTGNFDGGGHVITGLTVNRESEPYVGLFGYVGGGMVRNLGLENVSVSGSSIAGGVAGSLHNSAVSNCYVTGAVSGNTGVGGVAGVVEDSDVSNCYVTATVRGNYNNVGGVAGNVDGGSTVTNCYATASVSGTGDIGGVAGNVWNSAVTNCAALNPSVDGSSGVGRVVGWSVSSTLTGNRAFAGMICVSANPGDDGADMARTDAVTPGFWTGAMGWDDTVWTLAQGKLPTLHGEDGEPGLGLTGLPTGDLDIDPADTQLDYSGSARTVDFTVTGWEAWTHQEIKFTASGGDIASSENGKATLTVPGGFSGTITVTASNENSRQSVTAKVQVAALSGGSGGTGTGSGSGGSGSGSRGGSSTGGTTAAATAKRTVDVEHLGGYRFRVDLPLLGYLSASVDGETLVRGQHYTLRSGSTVLTLTDSYVATLKAGQHTLRMEFLSAVGTTEFTVSPMYAGGDADTSDAPALTGSGSGNDNMNPSTGGVAAAGSVAVLLAVVGLWAVLPGRMGR